MEHDPVQGLVILQRQVVRDARFVQGDCFGSPRGDGYGVVVLEDRAEDEDVEERRAEERGDGRGGDYREDDGEDSCDP